MRKGYVEVLVLVALLITPQVVWAEDTDEEEADETPVVAVKPAAPKLPVPKKLNVVYAIAGSELIPLEATKVQLRMKSDMGKRAGLAALSQVAAAFVPMGAVASLAVGAGGAHAATSGTQDMVGIVEGATSPVRITNRRPTFVVKAQVPAIAGVSNSFAMIPVKTVRKHREFVHSSMNFTLFSADHKDTAALNKVVELESEEHPTCSGAVVLTPTKPLAPGEYVIQSMLSETVSCFSVGEARETSSGE